MKLSLCLAGLFALLPLAAQNERAEWSKPFPPHKVIGNIYYVGSNFLASYLITTPQGHILINSDFEQTVPLIRSSVEKLGFKFTDIRIVLGSHAHDDHMEGDAMVKEMTGARVMAMQRDRDWLEKITPGGKPHPIDHLLHDEEMVKLGGAVLTAHLTPGHTPGCTTWSTTATEAGKTYNVVIVCSVGVNPGYKLVDNKEYPPIAADYTYSFGVLRKLPCDVFLGAHGNFYDLEGKYARLQQGGPNPFIDHDGYLAYIDLKEREFNAELARQTSSTAK